MKCGLNAVVALFVFCKVVVISSYPLMGRWVANIPGVVVDIGKTHVIGTVNEKESVEMKIVRTGENTVALNDLRVRKKPPDWFNIVKYKNHFDIFQKIKQYGLICHFHFIDHDLLEVRPEIGDSVYEFTLSRFHDPELKKK